LEIEGFGFLPKAATLLLQRPRIDLAWFEFVKIRVIRVSFRYFSRHV
jgi:hypothetical protein